jgi:hypothetical protein
MNLKFETDYAFRPTPAGFLGIPPEYHEGLRDGSLELVLRRCVTPNRWCIVQAAATPDRTAPWDFNGVVHRLDEQPDLMLFTEHDWSSAAVDYGGHFDAYIRMSGTKTFADQGKPLWTRYRVDPKKRDALQKRREKAVKCAASFNAHAGLAPCAVEELSNDALAVLCLQRNRHGNPTTVWMHRSLANAVLQAVRAGHAVVTADGSVESNDNAVTAAKQEWTRRGLYLTWEEPAHILKRIEALRSHPRYHLSSFKGKHPETEYSMRDLY